MKLSFVTLLLLSSTVSGRYGHGRSHSYPHSSGHSGYGSGSTHTSHSYPASTGLSGTSNSANVQRTYHQHQATQYNYSPRTEVHQSIHYHYSPPHQISYGSTYHPVYQGHPPVYVYEYRDSGSRFDTLLTGLALYNLGRSSHSHHYDSDRQYSTTPGEICKLGISKRTGEYEETRIECKLMSSFILESPVQNEQHVIKNTTEVKVTQFSNGTGNVNSNSSVTTLTVKSEVVDALNVKGPSIAVTPGMTCYMIRMFRDTTTLRKPVDCGLLQEYARSSLYRNVSESLTPHVTILFYLLVYLMIF